MSRVPIKKILRVNPTKIFTLEGEFENEFVTITFLSFRRF
jgi:hypothetical protein